MISTRGRYALRVLIDLAGHQDEGFIPMKKVAERQEISFRYLEQIMPLLMKDSLVDGVSGKKGGYRLNRPLNEYVVGHILRLTEGNLSSVACLECGEKTCSRISECKTLPMWERFSKLTYQFFDSITLEDLINGEWESIDKLYFEQK